MITTLSLKRKDKKTRTHLIQLMETYLKKTMETQELSLNTIYGNLLWKLNNSHLIQLMKTYYKNSRTLT